MAEPVSRLRIIWRCFWLLWHAFRADVSRQNAAVHQVKAWRAIGRVAHHKDRLAVHRADEFRRGRHREGRHEARR